MISGIIKNSGTWSFGRNEDDIITPEEHMGCVYVLEVGSVVKIGSTQSPKKRIKTLRRNSRNCLGAESGAFIISEYCTNYFENEKLLHKDFSRFRIGETELFNISIDYFLKHAPRLCFIDDRLMVNERASIATEKIKQIFLSASIKSKRHKQTFSPLELALAVAIGELSISELSPKELDVCIEEQEVLFLWSIIKKVKAGSQIKQSWRERAFSILGEEYSKEY